jgi:hypothetical protein
LTVISTGIVGPWRSAGVAGSRPSDMLGVETAATVVTLEARIVLLVIEGRSGMGMWKVLERWRRTDNHSDVGRVQRPRQFCLLNAAMRIAHDRVRSIISLDTMPRLRSRVWAKRESSGRFLIDPVKKQQKIPMSVLDCHAGVDRDPCVQMPQGALW